MNNTIRNYINNIARFLDNVSISFLEKRFDEVLRNARITAESVCKLILYNFKIIQPQLKTDFCDFNINMKGQEVIISIGSSEGKFAIQYPNQYPRPLMLNDLIKIIEKLDLIKKHEIFDAFIYLRDKGNDASHSNDFIFNENDALNVKENIGYIINWLFADILNIEIPAEIKIILNRAAIILDQFDSIDVLMSKEPYKTLFENNLVYYTDQELQDIKEISADILNEHVYLITGRPAQGKSVTAISLAKDFEKLDYGVFYHSFKFENSNNLWEDIKNCLYKRFLFIIDDCHLNIETASKIYYKLKYKLPEVKACILFISRTIDSKESDIENLELFEQMKKTEIKVDSDNFYKKTKGIIKKYQEFYEKSSPSIKYEIGNIEKLTDNCLQNLFTLYSYIKIWKNSQSTLSDININEVYEATYNQYFKKLSDIQIKGLLKYASLYLFEIEFESIPNIYKETENLFETGIIEKKNKKYNFIHSDFANLLINSFIVSYPYFKREFKTKENFIYEQIKEYILSFEKISYPENIYKIIKNLYVNNEFNLLKNLLEDNQVKNIILNYYTSEEISEINMLISFICLAALTKIEKNLFIEYFENITIKNINYNRLILNSKKPLENNNCLWYVLNKMTNNAQIIRAFENIFTQEENKEMFLKAYVKEYPENNTIFNDISNDSELSLPEFGPDFELFDNFFEIKGLLFDVSINYKTGRKIEEIYKQIDSDELTDHIYDYCKNDLNNMAEIINELNNFDSETTSKINFQKIIDNFLKSKENYLNHTLRINSKKFESDEANYHSYLSDLESLNHIDIPELKSIIIKNLQLEKLEEYINSGDIDYVLSLLELIKDINKEIFQKYVQKINLTEIISKIKTKNLTDIINDLRHWKYYDNKIYQKILNEINFDKLIDYNQNYDFDTIIKIYDLIDFNNENTIFDYTKFNFAINSHSQENITYFLNYYEKLAKITPEKTYKILNDIKESDIVNFLESQDCLKTSNYLKIIKDNNAKLYKKLNYKKIISNSKFSSQNNLEKFISSIQQGEGLRKFNEKILEYIVNQELGKLLKSYPFQEINNLLNTFYKIDLNISTKIIKQIGIEHFVNLIDSADYKLQILDIINKIDHETALKIIHSLDKYKLTERFKKGYISITILHDIDKKFWQEIINNSYETILKQIKKLKFTDIPDKLIMVGIENSEKLLNEIPLDELIKRAENETLFDISETLGKIGAFNFQKSKEILQHLNITTLCHKAEETEVYLLCQALYWLNDIDENIARKIYQNLNFDRLINYVKNTQAFNDCTFNLFYLSKVDNEKTKILANYLSYDNWINDNEHCAMGTLVNALNNIYDINREIAQAFFDKLSS